jgi:hypothetical protein
VDAGNQQSRNKLKELQMEVANKVTAGLIDGYYDSWRSGDSSVDKTRVSGILAENLDFAGPIAGKRQGSAGFIAGLTRFVEGLQAPIRIVQRVDSDQQAAVLYDADLPMGTMRFAEFLTVGAGRIQAIRLVYDAAQYRALGGR